ncbi:phosphotransferase [Amycolatopsis acidicola]|uniref:Phosphotransferase n=1 Tax=Amycolatopsis acidicola TaxID=2596893 RepID=A0A5N0VDF8_9PSEU|nr:phosphotransferase [Amycolatopsis acidicola]KAA9164387.1 phosphotransferase [Amycolatopsis acidicola]
MSPGTLESALAGAVEARYGLALRFERVGGEVDLNFRGAGDVGRYFLKVSRRGSEPPADPRLLAYLSDRRPRPSVATPLSTRDGALWFDVDPAIALPGPAGRWCAWLTTLLPGSCPQPDELGSAERRAVGRALAELDLALAGTKIVRSVPVRWDVRRAGDALLELTGTTPPVAGRDVLAAELERLRDDVLPRLAELPVQLVHNDFNKDNILVEDGRVTGIVDFGDAVYAPRVQDLGTAAAYFCRAPDISETIGDLVAGYHAVLPLDAGEIALVPEIARGRCALALTLARCAAARTNSASHRAYLLRNEKLTGDRLAALRAAARDAPSAGRSPVQVSRP